jgi:biofilm PGA synthesis lipoprotein PgaB
MLAYRLPDPQQQARLAVKINDADGLPKPAQRDYDRLSPFLPETAQLIGDIYGDLGKNTAGIAGLLIHDDAYLAEDEDVTAGNPEARWPGTDKSIKTYPLSAREKTQALIDFGKVVTNRLRYYNDFSSGFSVARNMYARVVMDPAAEARFAQALEPFMQHYNHVALMAMPYLDDAKESPRLWLQKLARTVASTPGAMQRVVFELQAKNWKTDQWIDGATLKQWMQLLVRMGGVNLAYYPDDFLNNQPPFQATFEGISLQDSPYHQLKL